MIIIDSSLTQSQQEDIKSLFFSNYFPWFFKPETTFSENNLNTPCLSHFFVIDGQINSPYSSVINLLVTENLDKFPNKIKNTYKDITQARAFKQFPLHENFCKTKVDPLHVDCEYDHYVLIYYVTDNDANTLITDTKFKKDKKISTDINDHKIVETIKPVQGRLVLFDGNYYHTAEQPTNDIRCIINIDLVKPKPV